MLHLNRLLRWVHYRKGTGPMNHITFLLKEWAVRRRDASTSTALRFAGYAEKRWTGDESTAELWEEFKSQSWALHTQASHNQSGLEQE